MAKPIKIVKRMGIFAQGVTVEIEVTGGFANSKRTPLTMQIHDLENLGHDRWKGTYNFPMGNRNSLPKTVIIEGDLIFFKS